MRQLRAHRRKRERQGRPRRRHALRDARSAIDLRRRLAGARRPPARTRSGRSPHGRQRFSRSCAQLRYRQPLDLGIRLHRTRRRRHRAAGLNHIAGRRGLRQHRNWPPGSCLQHAVLAAISTRPHVSRVDPGSALRESALQR